MTDCLQTGSPASAARPARDKRRLALDGDVCTLEEFSTCSGLDKSYDLAILRKSECLDSAEPPVAITASDPQDTAVSSSEQGFVHAGRHYAGVAASNPNIGDDKKDDVNASSSGNGDGTKGHVSAESSGDDDWTKVDANAKSSHDGDGTKGDMNAASSNDGDGTKGEVNAESFSDGDGNRGDMNAESSNIGDGTKGDENAKSFGHGDGEKGDMVRFKDGAALIRWMESGDEHAKASTLLKKGDMVRCNDCGVARARFDKMMMSGDGSLLDDPDDGNQSEASLPSLQSGRSSFADNMDMFERLVLERHSLRNAGKNINALSLAGRPSQNRFADDLEKELKSIEVRYKQAKKTLKQKR